MNTAVIKLIVWKLVSTTETKWSKTIVKIQNFIAIRWNLFFWNFFLWNLTRRLTNVKVRLRMEWFKKNVNPFKWYVSQLMHYHFDKRALFCCSFIFGSFEENKFHLAPVFVICQKINACNEACNDFINEDFEMDLFAA